MGILKFLGKLISHFKPQQWDDHNNEKEYLFLERVIASTIGHIYWKDKNGIYLGCNDNQAKTLGYQSGKDIIGKTDFDLPWKGQAPFLRKIDLEVTKNKKPYIIEEPVIINSEIRVFLSSKAPLEDEYGKIIGILGVSFDITDRKKAEEKALQLEKEKASIEAAKNQIISDLASSIAHEIGNLLSGIIIHEQLLSQRLKPQITEGAKKHDESGQEIQELLNTLEKCLGNAKYMFESIKMNIRQGGIEKSQFVLTDIAEDIETVLNSCFPNEEKVAEIKWNKEQNFEYLGMPAYTRNILINLIKNALYFIKEERRGDISITLKKGKKFNELIFKDTAKGIAAGALPKLFTRFSTTCRGGTGMGLTFCKMVMQECGGDIVCKSELGKYTKFILTFPAIIIE